LTHQKASHKIKIRGFLFPPKIVIKNLAKISQEIRKFSKNLHWKNNFPPKKIPIFSPKKGVKKMSQQQQITKEKNPPKHS
jgi:hypothetical protein